MKYIHHIIKDFVMSSEMSETIRDFFKRYDHGVTESVYSRITMLDFQRNKAASQFLDYDRDNLFRKNKLICGVRNIDNTCYLSVTIQILYNIQSLREKVFSITQQTQNKFIEELQVLFAMMLKGSLCYVDPTELFAILKSSRPDVFIPGSQNDFHEVFTLVLEELEKAMPNEEQRKFIRKIFYGKSRVSLSANKSNESHNQNIFSIINLSSKSGSFQKAIMEYKKQKIEGYRDEKGSSVNAEREIDFIETPALLTFFINRVEYKDKKLVKDSSEFTFSQTIFFNKKNLKSNSKIVNDTELQKQQMSLTGWIEKVQISKGQLIQTLKYFEEKQFQNINLPTINNQKGEPQKQNTKAFLLAQIQAIENKIKEVRVQIEQIRRKRIKLAEENYSQLYTLLGLMIHCGKSAQSGHYKLCISINGQWVQFNDRRTEIIPQQKIMEYKKKGEICCLFYRRSSLICQSEKNQVPATLKKVVQEKEKNIFKNIDNARILQSLYQQSQTVNILFEFEAMAISKNKYSYFFKPLSHLLKTNRPIQVCKGYLLYQMIQNPKFIKNLKQKLLFQTQVEIPKIKFQFPDEYLSLSEGLKQFMDIEMTLNNPVEAFDLISFYMDVSLTDKLVKQEFEQVREIITIKGIFYESMFVEFGLISIFQQLAKSVDKLINSMNQQSSFVLIFIPIRHQILRKSKISKQISGVLKKTTINGIDNYSQAFFERFKFEIQLRNKLMEVDESVLKEFKKLYSRYMAIMN